ncbi:MAG: helix-turn-helix domain-containing protein [Candidatus Binatia bacterium]
MNDLANSAGLARQALSRVLTGERPATVTTGKKLAAALERWAQICQREAKRIRSSLGRETP